MFWMECSNRSIDDYFNNTANHQGILQQIQVFLTTSPSVIPMSEATWESPVIMLQRTIDGGDCHASLRTGSQ